MGVVTPLLCVKLCHSGFPTHAGQRQLSAADFLENEISFKTSFLPLFYWIPLVWWIYTKKIPSRLLSLSINVTCRLIASGYQTPLKNRTCGRLIFEVVFMGESSFYMRNFRTTLHKKGWVFLNQLAHMNCLNFLYIYKIVFFYL